MRKFEKAYDFFIHKFFLFKITSREWKKKISRFLSDRLLFKMRLVNMLFEVNFWNILIFVVLYFWNLFPYFFSCLEILRNLFCRPIIIGQKILVWILKEIWIFHILKLFIMSSFWMNQWMDERNKFILFVMYK